MKAALTLTGIEKRAWAEIRRSQRGGRWAKTLKYIAPNRYDELVRMIKKGGR
jgi:hypothetical protein